MKFFRSYLLFGLANMLCFFDAYAQKSVVISGLIVNNQGGGLALASVFLLREDSSVVKLTITDKQGAFSFTGITTGKYFIAATVVGYQKGRSAPFMLNESDLPRIKIKLIAKRKRLTEVTITGHKSFIETKAGEVVLNMDNSLMRVGNTALEILKRAPGVQLDNNGDIKLNGKPDVLVMIDNKQTYLQGAALTDYLQAIQGNLIGQIELISNPGATYDAAGAGGIINIKLKKDKSLGTNGAIMFTSGVLQPDMGYNSKFKWGSGFNFNHRTKKVNIFGSYNYSDMPAERISLSNRFVNSGSQPVEIAEDYFSDQSRKTHSFRLGADYNITSNQIIGFIFNGSVTDLCYNKKTKTNFLTQPAIDTAILTTAHQSGKIKFFAVDVNYKASIGKHVELAVDADYSPYDRNPLELINSKYFYTNNPSANKSIDLQNAFPSHFRVYTGNVDVKVNLDSTSFVRGILKSSYVTTDNILNFGQILDNVYTPFTRFNSEFYYNEKIHAAALLYNKTFSKKVMLELGLRVEQTRSNIKNTYTDFFPNAQLTDELDNNNQLLFTYSRRISRPRYEDLNPFIAFQDQYTYNIGNPNLKPYYINNVEFTHSYKSRFTTTLRFALWENFTQAIFTQNDFTKVITTRKANLGNRYIYGLQLNASVDFNSCWNANFNLDASLQRFTNTSNQGDLNVNTQDVAFKIQQNFNLYKGFRASLFTQYETPTTFGILKYQSTYRIDMAFSKNVLKRHANVQLQLNDIFNTDRDRYSSTYQNLDIAGNQKRDFRTIQVNFTYTFGSKNIKAVRKRVTGAEDEQGRAAGAN